MKDELEEKIDPYNPLEIAKGVFWVGFYDADDKLNCNPYLIIDGEEAVLIDGGSRPHFSSIMLNILKTGIKPKNIIRLIYSHYDPDLCSSIPHMEEIINSNDLKIISHKSNNVFIKYYSTGSERTCIEDLNYEFSFTSGRTLRFIHVPYAHAAGSFLTYDEKNKILFSSDLFGCYGNSEVFFSLKDSCMDCDPVKQTCDIYEEGCPLKRMLYFHKELMSSTKALRYALNAIKDLDIEIVASQHGSIIKEKKLIKKIIDELMKLEQVGIDGVC